MIWYDVVQSWMFGYQVGTIYKYNVYNCRYIIANWLLSALLQSWKFKKIWQGPRPLAPEGWKVDVFKFSTLQLHWKIFWFNWHWNSTLSNIISFTPIFVNLVLSDRRNSWRGSTLLPCLVSGTGRPGRGLEGQHPAPLSGIGGPELGYIA